MKSLFLALICTFSVSALASWEVTTSTSDNATTVSEIQNLRAKYPQDLKYLSSADWYFMTSLSVQVDVWTWIGETTCPVGSPELTLRDVSYNYSLNGPFGTYGQAVFGDLAVNNLSAPPCE